MIKQFETLEKRMVSIEHNNDFLEQMIKERSAYYEKMIVTQGENIHIFKEYIKNELIYFFKHKKRVQEDI